MSTQTEALRKLADFIEMNPRFDTDLIHFTTASTTLGIHIYTDDKKATIKALTRALHGAWSKSVSSNNETMYVTQRNVFGYFSATIFVDRDAVCERKLVGTKEIEHPAREASGAFVETVPVYEWECGSILAPEVAA